MDIVKFAESVGGEVVAGGVVATVDGKRQHLYQGGVFTPVGEKLYNAWEHAQPEVPLDIPMYVSPETNADLVTETAPMGISTGQGKSRRKPNTSVGD